MKVWIDLANSPHPLLFAPVAARLHELGHEVVATARDAAQTLELARDRWRSVVRIGGPSPSAARAKAQAIGARALDLRRFARLAQPDVALSHNSYAQLVAARSLGIPAVTAMDYEHQPANHVAFRFADRILLPAALPLASVRRQGAVARKVERYDGLKEELYLGDFEPDPDVLASVGVEPDGAVIVVLRAPPRGAVYHRFDNPVFDQALRELAARDDVRCVVLTRHPEQREALAALRAANLVVPERAVDARSLMYAADLVVGAGGTMTREAALLHVPTVSVFAGKPPSVDIWLERRGRLRRLTDARELRDVGPRSTDPVPVGSLRERGAQLVERFCETTVAAARGGNA
ncbi:MAG: DUF354 domain-containing protein [Thermoleophilia bacterium]|nr:DUF354 domain-containing protein [Thermoleophilia bacterium]